MRLLLLRSTVEQRVARPEPEATPRPACAATAWPSSRQRRARLRRRPPYRDAEGAPTPAKLAARLGARRPPER